MIEVGFDTICRIAAPDHVMRHIAPAGIYKSADNIASAIQLCDRAELILIQETLHQNTIDLLANTPVLAIHDILDLRAIRQCDVQQVAQNIVVIGCGLAAVGLAEQFAVS